MGVRIVIPNLQGQLGVGDYARATISLPAGSKAKSSGIYDSELADCWICPRHPHIIAKASGKCPLSGQDLVPTSQYGYVSQSFAESEALTVPRDAVLMAGEHSVLYVETKPGRLRYASSYSVRSVVSRS